MALDPKKVIVTGGAGFTGSHTVVELQAAGFVPIIVDNFCNSDRSVVKQIEQITGTPIVCHEVDCNEEHAFRRVFESEEGVFGVIHFAAYKAVGESVQQPLKYYRNNVGSLIVLLELMRQFEVRHLVFSSSCTVYGQPEVLPVTEETPTKRAESPYGATKQICESIIGEIVKAGEPIKAVILRYFNPIGAHSSSLIGELPLGTPENLVPFITQTAVGIREALTVFGDDYNTPDGSCIRDYIHVVDLAKVHVRSLDWVEEQEADSLVEIFNVGTGMGCSVFEAIKAFEAASGQELSTIVGPRREGDVERIFADVDKARRVLDWSAELSLEDAMRDAWNWQLALRDSCSSKG